MSNQGITLFLTRPKNIMKCFGVWPLENVSRERLLLSNIYKFIIMASQYSFLFFEFIYIANVFGDLDEVFEASFLLFTQASLCYKTTVFIVNKKNFFILLEMMRSEILLPQNPLHEQRLQQQSKVMNRLSMFFFVMANMTCSLWALMPLFDNSEIRTFPFKIWMPFDVEQSPQYELGYLYQIISIYISACLFAAVDNVTLALVMFGSAQLDIIGDKLSTIKNVPPPEEMEQEERKKFIQENREIFVECIKQHQSVISFIEIVENTFHANIFFQLSGTVLIICIIGLQITAADPHSVEFFSMVNYMMAILAQLFLYCWCGQEITIRSELLSEWVYQCPWYEQDLKFSRLVIIAMERMKRPIIFRAGHYIPLSRATFVSILRSSYSYFAVLNQAKKK